MLDWIFVICTFVLFWVGVAAWRSWFSFAPQLFVILFVVDLVIFWIAKMVEVKGDRYNG